MISSRSRRNAVCAFIVLLTASPGQRHERERCTAHSSLLSGAAGEGLCKDAWSSEDVALVLHEFEPEDEFFEFLAVRLSCRPSGDVPPGDQHVSVQRLIGREAMS